MLNFKYLLGYQIGDQVDLARAKALLAEYNDFHAFNVAQYQNCAKARVHEDGIYREEEVDAEEAKQLEKKAFDDVGEFEKVWGSVDFAAAALVGMSVEWDKIQEKLLEEQRKNIRPADSGMKEAGRTLRKAASILTYSERVVTTLRAKHIEEDMITLMKHGFEMLLAEVKKQGENIEIPEFSGVEKTRFSKIKTADGIIDYANKLFELGK